MSPERVNESLEIARIMDWALFPCGHPRTPENTKPNNNRPGGRCRTCQRVHERESQRKRRLLQQ